MKNVMKVSALSCLFASAVFTGCKKDSEDKLPDTVNIKTPAGGFTVQRLKTLKLGIETSVPNATWEWRVDGEVVSNDSVCYFIAGTEGQHQVIMTVSNGFSSATSKASIQVTKETTDYSKGNIKVYDFLQAPGQFVNDMPAYKTGDDEAKMIASAEAAINSGYGVSLGSYGGYVVMGLDHAIMNVPGEANFRVLGNGFNTWSEAGVIEVSVDANGNGLADDEWYEIAGSVYNKTSTIKNYEITYFKPDENKERVTDENNPFIADLEYIKWTDNQGGTGYVYRNTFYPTKSYYPLWKGTSITFRGTKMANDRIKNSSDDIHAPYWTSEAFDFGYADNWPNDKDESAIKLDWAISKKSGKPVRLSAVHFIRVYTGLLADLGWLGELSTEVFGLQDLNISKK